MDFYGFFFKQTRYFFDTIIDYHPDHKESAISVSQRIKKSTQNLLGEKGLGDFFIFFSRSISDLHQLATATSELKNWVSNQKLKQHIQINRKLLEKIYKAIEGLGLLLSNTLIASYGTNRTHLIEAMHNLSLTAQIVETARSEARLKKKFGQKRISNEELEKVKQELFTLLTTQSFGTYMDKEIVNPIITKLTSATNSLVPREIKLKDRAPFTLLVPEQFILDLTRLSKISVNSEDICQQTTEGQRATPSEVEDFKLNQFIEMILKSESFHKVNSQATIESFLQIFFQNLGKSTNQKLPTNLIQPLSEIMINVCKDQQLGHDLIIQDLEGSSIKLDINSETAQLKMSMNFKINASQINSTPLAEMEEIGYFSASFEINWVPSDPTLSEIDKVNIYIGKLCSNLEEATLDIQDKQPSNLS